MCVLTGSLSAVGGLSGSLSMELPTIHAQGKTVVPSMEEQIIVPDAGYNALSKVIVEKIPQNYGLITYNGSWITVS